MAVRSQAKPSPFPARQARRARVVGQIAKIKGCRVIGIAGGAEKCHWLTDEAGFDASIDYKSEDVQARLKELCPKEIDIFFDDVGGEHP